MGTSIIHFSDIHINNAKNAIFSKKNSIIAACEREIHSNSDVIIICSGDIAFSGEEGQYVLFDEFLSDICKALINDKKAKVTFLPVAGNHDCHFSKNDSVRDTLIKNVNYKGIDDNYYKTVSSVQSEYVEYAKKYNNESDKMVSFVEINTENGIIGFILVNTAWLSELNDIPGKIMIPKSFFHKINRSKYKLVSVVCHHPISWFNVEGKMDFTDYIRHNSDIVLVGHEHQRDQYKQVGTDYSINYCHAKELQDSDNPNNSAFSVINLKDNFKNYTIYDYKWDGKQYIQEQENDYSLEMSSSTLPSIFYPNKSAMSYANDAGLIINHFAKEDVGLNDLFVWPDIKKVTYKSDRTVTTKIKIGVFGELQKNQINIILGSDTSGKTSFAKYLFSSYATMDVCCVLIKGSDFSSFDNKTIKKNIETVFSNEYAVNRIDEFWNLPKEKRVIIIDDFGTCKYKGEKRNSIFDELCEKFGVIYLFISSDIELPSLMASKSVNEFPSFFYYEIMPLGNKKRKDLISKWYHISSDDIEEDEIEKRIENSEERVNGFLQNGAGIIPAYPIAVIGVLQNSDLLAQSKNSTQYSFLYESMIKKSLISYAGNEYEVAGNYNVDIGVVSLLAFNMLVNKKTYFSREELNESVKRFNEDQKVDVSSEGLFNKMIGAKLFCKDSNNDDLFRFRYPYIFYYFAGNYIAYHLNDESVQKEIEHMSEHLYIEHYGNIMVFVCYFANNEKIIDSVLLNAYNTLDKYEVLDVSKTNMFIQNIAATVETIVPKLIVSNDEVSTIRDERLQRLDDAGINNGEVIQGDDVIDDDISDDWEKDFADISASFRIMDVLGQILQNYPGNIDGHLKIGIIDEVVKLGLRSVQGIIKTMGFFEQYLVEFIYDRAIKEKKTISREQTIYFSKKFINILIAGTVRGMISKIAVSFNNPIILPAVTEALNNQGTIASELVLIELKVNCFKHVNYNEIAKLHQKYDEMNEPFANYILSSIVSNYLNMNKCDYKKRSKLCNLFGFSEKKVLGTNQLLLTERGY